MMARSPTRSLDARPHPPNRRNLLHRTAGPYIGVIRDDQWLCLTPRERRYGGHAGTHTSCQEETLLAVGDHPTCSFSAYGSPPWVARGKSQLHLHPYRIESEGVALLGHVANTRPWEVIGEQRDLLVREHAKHLHARLRRLLRVGIVLELCQRLLQQQDGMMGKITDVAQLLPT